MNWRAVVLGRVATSRQRRTQKSGPPFVGKRSGRPAPTNLAERRAYAGPPVLPLSGLLVRHDGDHVHHHGARAPAVLSRWSPASAGDLLHAIQSNTLAVIFNIHLWVFFCQARRGIRASRVERWTASKVAIWAANTSESILAHREFSRTRSSRYAPRSASSTEWKTVIEQVVSYFRHAAQGLEEKKQKQILYLLGPVGAASRSFPTQ